MGKPCCETCACMGESFDCLAVVAPERYRHFAEWCRGDVPSQRMLVRDMSRMGLAAIDAMNPRTPPPASDAVKDAGPNSVPAAPTLPLAGDVVAGLAASVGADRAAKWVAEKLTGVPDCGCKSRQDALNRLDRKARRLVARLARREAPG